MASFGKVKPALKVVSSNAVSEWSSKMTPAQDKRWDKSVGLKEGSAMDRRLDSMLKGSKKKKG